MMASEIRLTFVGNWHPIGRKAIEDHVRSLPDDGRGGWTLYKDRLPPRPIYALQDGWHPEDGYGALSVKDLLEFFTHYYELRGNQ